MNTIVILITLLAAAFLIAAVCILAYKRRINRIAKGELRDTHNPLPAPETTVNSIYKVVLMVVVVIALLNTSALQGQINSMQSTINDLRSAQGELYSLREVVEKTAKRVDSMAFEFFDLDPASKTGKIRITANLKEYSENTTLSLRVSGQEIPFERTVPGTYDTTFTADLFAPYTEAVLHITDSGRTFVEPVYDVFPMHIFWEYLPMPGIQSTLYFTERFGKISYTGDYYICADHPEDIETASVTYLSGGRELASADVTRETKNHEKITPEKGMALERNLSLKIEIVTKSGFRITQQMCLFGPFDGQDDPDFTQIRDLNGNILWEIR